MDAGAVIAVDIRPISAADSIDAAAPLLREHWLELAKHRDLMVLAPHVDGYRELERLGALIAVAAFDGDEMVGYAVSIFHARHLHYSGLAAVSNDVLFVRRTHRGAGIGHALMAETERQAIERGAAMVFWHAKRGTALDALLFERGYEVQDVIYGKPLQAAAQEG